MTTATDRARVERSCRPLGRTKWRLACLLVSFVALAKCGSGPARSTLPATLSDEQFWGLSTRLSEPPGSFTHSQNLVSNEADFVHAIRMLRPRKGVYIGVGPEQNFSYISRLRPEMAFIIDIRSENRNLHLMYKALFELSADRADFISRLFSRERPAGLTPRSSPRVLFSSFAPVAPRTRLFEANLQLVRARLIEAHRFPLAAEDFAWIEHVLQAFYSDGPDIQYGRSRPREAPGPSYRVLMSARDVAGRSRSYLATEDAFAFVKDLQARNLVVPVVGDFAGPDAIRRTGEYVRRHGAVVNAFYGSNVEVYLTREKLRAFCGSLATLPHDAHSWFIGSKGIQRFESKLKSCAPGPPLPTWTPQP